MVNFDAVLSDFLVIFSGCFYMPNIYKFSIIKGVTLLCTACTPIPKTYIESCPYQAGQSVVETYPDMLRSTDIPIDHIIVPMIVISPYAKKHYVSHHVYDHTSILRFVQARFNLSALTARDAHARSPIGMFDFEHPSFTKPPELPRADEDPRFLNECEDSARTH
ncbi:alkaline phosphatase family protein [Methylobacter tundripaludum]|uniref:alkaline phosphatase family protein n=1 Tax=Methylobacter tundripaludum TaxID=173365 RepID=UPI0001E524F6|nr:alkaline phosphatase family protein [Methylobacter tundripaludum]